jgi:hypothetical protein
MKLLETSNIVLQHFYTSLKHSTKYGILDFYASYDGLSLSLKYFLNLKSYLQSRHFLVNVQNEHTEVSSVNVGYPKAVP